EVLSVILSIYVGGTFFPIVAVCFCIVLLVWTFKPGLFAKHFDASLITGSPYRREASKKAWGISLLLCFCIAGGGTWIRYKFFPGGPYLPDVTADKVGKRLAPLVRPQQLAEQRGPSINPEQENPEKKRSDRQTPPLTKHIQDPTGYLVLVEPEIAS